MMLVSRLRMNFMQLIGSIILIFCAINLTLFVIDRRFKTSTGVGSISVDILNTIAFWVSFVVSLLIAIPIGLSVFMKLVALAKIADPNETAASSNRLKYLGSLIGSIILASSFVWVCHFILSYFFQPNLEDELGATRYKAYLISYSALILFHLIAHLVIVIIGGNEIFSLYSGFIAFAGVASLLLPVNSATSTYTPLLWKGFS